MWWRKERELLIQRLFCHEMDPILLLLLLIPQVVLANVPHQPFPPEENTLPSVVVSSSSDSIDPTVLTDTNQVDWRPRISFETSLDSSNLTIPSITHPSSHEANGNKRYPVASFDFNHVATPYIISLWIIIVGLAKIGESFHLT